MSAEEEKSMLAFKTAFAKYKANREKIPLHELKSRYGKAYKQLLDEVDAGSKWFCEGYLNMIYSTLHFHGDDQEGYNEFKRRWAAICAEEKKPGRLYDQQRAALFEQLDFGQFEDLVYALACKLITEAYDPYWQRHCIRLDNGEIYNDIIKKFWRRTSGSRDLWHWVDKAGREGPYFPPREQ